MSLVPMILGVSSDAECVPLPQTLTTYDYSKAPVVLDRGVDTLLLSYSSYMLPGKLSESPYSALIRRAESNGGWDTLKLSISGSEFSITPRRRPKDSESPLGKVLYINHESRPLINIFIRKDRHPYKPDVLLRLHPALLDWVGDAPAIASVRYWINCNLYPGLTPSELRSIERVSSVDLKTDFLVPLDSQYDLTKGADRYLVTRLKRYGVYTNESTDRLTGFLLGVKRDLRIRIYDKCTQADSRGILSHYLSHWHLTPDATQESNHLIIDGTPSTVWRIECQMSRRCLRDSGVTTYEQLCESDVSLFRKAFGKRITMRQLSEENSGRSSQAKNHRPYSRNSFTPFWSSVIDASLSDCKYTGMSRLSIAGVTLKQDIVNTNDFTREENIQMDTSKVKEIVLTDSTNIALVSVEDFERVSRLKWHLKPDNHCNYAQASIPRSNGKYTTTTLHRFIMSPTPGVYVDHINGNGLDCRRENLRLATPAQNAHNSRPHKGRQYKGVYSKKNKYQAIINNKYLGTYKTPGEAAAAYNRAADAIWGEYAKLNAVPVIDSLDGWEGFRVPRWVAAANLLWEERASK